MMDSSDRMWSAEGKYGKPLQQHSFLENPMNSVTRQKDMTPEDEPPRSVGVQYATGEEWRNSSRKRAGPKWKQCSVLDVSGGKRTLLHTILGLVAFTYSQHISPFYR